LPIKQTLNFRILEFTKYREFIEVILLSFLSFAIPLYLGHPQILVGVIVNALIIRTALTIKGWKILPTVLLPSIGALARGILFGPFTVFLVYFIPFIWLGNLSIAYFSKLLSKKNSIITVFVSSFIKTSIIFIPVLVLVKLSVVPNLFLKSMGLVQLITAVVGSGVAFGITKVEKRFSSEA
jgi:hypothetical protein